MYFVNKSCRNLDHGRDMVPNIVLLGLRNAKRGIFCIGIMMLSTYLISLLFLSFS